MNWKRTLEMHRDAFESLMSGKGAEKELALIAKWTALKIDTEFHSSFNELLAGAEREGWRVNKSQIHFFHANYNAVEKLIECIE